MPNLDFPNLELPKIGGSDEEAEPEIAAAEAEAEVEQLAVTEESTPEEIAPIIAPIERPKIAMRAGSDTALPYAWIEVEQSKPNAPTDMTPVAGDAEPISLPVSPEPASAQPAYEPDASPGRFSWLKRLTDRIEAQ